jgi:hypothetical protein
MKSKSYILMQIKDLLLNRRDYSERRASAYIEDVKEKTVYELLTLKKELNESDELYPDVSLMRTIRHGIEDEDD